MSGDGTRTTNTNTQSRTPQQEQEGPEVTSCDGKGGQSNIQSFFIHLFASPGAGYLQ